MTDETRVCTVCGKQFTCGVKSMRRTDSAECSKKHTDRYRREYAKNYHKSYVKTPQYAETLRRRRGSAKYAEYQKKLRGTPEMRQYMREYHTTAKYKEYQKKYQRMRRAQKRAAEGKK